MTAQDVSVPGGVGGVQLLSVTSHNLAYTVIVLCLFIKLQVVNCQDFAGQINNFDELDAAAVAVDYDDGHEPCPSDACKQEAQLYRQQKAGMRISEVQDRILDGLNMSAPPSLPTQLNQCLHSSNSLVEKVRCVRTRPTHIVDTSSVSPMTSTTAAPTRRPARTRIVPSTLVEQGKQR